MTLPLFDTAPLMPSPSKALRPYQSRAIISVRALVLMGKKRILCVGPTGCGKLVITANIIRSATLPVLFVGHRKEILDQCARQLADQGITHVGVIRANDSRYDPSASVQVGSISTLARRDKPFLGKPIIIIVDEAHRASSDSHRALLAEYPDAIVLGFTATPTRLDGRPLGGDLFEEIVQVATYLELLKHPDWLVAPNVFAGSELPDVSRVRRAGSDFDEDQLSDVVRDARLEGNVVEHWLARAHLHPVFTEQGARVPARWVEGERRRTVLFAVNVAHSQSLAARFEKAGVRVAHLDGGTPETHREAIFRDLAAGRLEVVCNCLVAVEGLDIPEIKCVVHARPTQSVTLWRQCLDAETEVLTERGFMGVDSIRQDDLIAAMDTETGTISWRPILSKVDRPLHQSETMMEIKSGLLDIRVTSGHRMVFKRIRFRGRWHNEWSVGTAAHMAEFRSISRIPVAGTQQARGVDLTDDELRFVGWFLTDGWLDKSNNTIRICQAETQPHLNEIDKCLIGCGFKFSKYRRIPTGGFPNGKPQFVYQVSYGKPRGRDKHLRGWGGKLDPFIDKNFSRDLENVTERQLGVILEAIHLGDGAKQLNDEWVRRSYHITTANRLFADRLQSLCIRRGWRCNIAEYNGRSAVVVHIKHIPFRSLNRGPVPSEHQPGERVWCVENVLGTIVIRRRGKTAIVGNCVGRSMRPWNGVTPLLLDHAGNFDRLGCPFEDVKWSLTERHRRVAGQEPWRKCPACGGYVGLSKTICPHCGAELRQGAAPAGLVETDEELTQRQTEPEALKWAYFWRQVVTAKSKGFKPGFASALYKEHYGVWPPRHWSEKIRSDFSTDALWQSLLDRRLARKAAREEQERREEQALGEAVERDAMGGASHEEVALARTIDAFDAPDTGLDGAMDASFADWLDDEGISKEENE